MNLSRCALILVDVQEEFMHPSWGEPYPRHADANMKKLLQAWRSEGLPVFYAVRHSVQSSDQADASEIPDCRLKAFAAPLAEETIVVKRGYDAFEDTNLSERLSRCGAKAVAVAGFNADRSVLATAWSAESAGFKAHVVTDAVSTFELASSGGKDFTAKEVYETAVRQLNKIAVAVTTQSMLEWVCGAAVTTFY
jgi:nicotinamidase-related amidase